MGAKNGKMERRCNNSASKANPVVSKLSKGSRKRRRRQINAKAKALAATSATISQKSGCKRSHNDQVIKIPAKKQRQNEMSPNHLECLSQKPPAEVLFSIKASNLSDFKKLLNSENMGKSKLMLCLRILSTACRSIHRESLKLLLGEILNDCSMFFKETLVKQLIEKNVSFPKEGHLNFKLYVLDIMEAMQLLLPEKSYNTICLILLYSKNFINDYLLGDDYTSDIARRYKKLHDNLSKPSTVNPANNFRDIPIFPSYKDLWDKCPVLKPNIIDGRYSSVHEYLETQFRLIREDFIRPLREGIDFYRLNGINQVSQDIVVYNDVGIKKVTLTANGVEHELQFNSELCSQFDWENSRRLVYGTLVCLTSDEFNSVHFGTVIDHDPAQLKVGIVSVKFEKPSFMLNIVNDKFIMIESGASFEATRYVLSSLQNIDENTFPLKEYIVELDKNLKKPNYLKKDTIYCIHSILRHQSSRKGKCDFPVSLYNDASWPPAKDFNLDESQLEAVKSALRWKLSIIQGPPGTGKTHVGLKIMEILLHNKRKWNDGTPIMVVCYTNHALDQFLEGVLKITEKVVRIGGQSNSEKLKPYTMKNIKQLGTRKTNYMSSIFKDTKLALESVISEITTLETLLTSTRENFLTPNDLKKYVKPEQYSSLFDDAPIYCHFKSNDVVEVLSIWLGLEGAKEKKINDDCAQNRQSLDTCESFASECECISNSDIAVKNTLDRGRSRIDIPTIHYHIRYPQTSSDDELTNLNRDIYLADASTSSVSSKNTDYFLDREKYIASSRLSTLDLLRTRNVWKLSTSDRWKLYFTWHDIFTNEITLAVEELKSQYESKISVLNEIRTEEQTIIAKNTLVVGMTTTDAAKFRNLVSSIKSKIVIVEEAAEVLEAQIVTSLSPHTEQLILIGDHQQLRPSPGVFELAKKFNLDISLFERLVKNGMPFIQLGIQHRMRPEISRLLVPNIYKDLANHPSVEKYSDVRGLVKNVFFVKHNHYEQQQANTSKENIHEASFIIVLCRYLIQQGYEPSQITILTSYTGQLLAVKRLMTETVAEVKATVIDNYQGEENDIVLLSLVRSNVESSIGFLSVKNRVCVALSRARKGLYCFGNFDLLGHQSPLWKNIILELTKHDQIGSELELKCQKHGNITTVRNCLDFDKVASGGCNKACGYRKPCGHLCEKRCHSVDNEHKESNCLMPCLRECPHGHQCNKMCCEDCGSCLVTMTKLLSKCCHLVEAPCYLNEQDVQCMEPCNLKLPCGHQCLKKCYEPCGDCKVWIVVIGSCDHPIKIQCGPSQNPVNLVRACEETCSLTLKCGHPCGKLCGSECETKCTFLIAVKLECGHVIMSQCYKSSRAKYLVDECASKCDSFLKCGHKCSGTCAQCFQGRIHVPCNVLCDSKLICGHSCKYTCCEGSCPPCSRKCEIRCGHRNCPNSCGEPCIPCEEQCDFYCKHSMCSQSCKKPCDREPCKMVCKKKLSCKHKCIGMCGEICPNLCRICDKETLKKELCEHEYKENARYLELEDCLHIFEIQGFTKWIESQCDSNLEIKQICCPRCETPIGNNSRFELEVKLITSRVEQIKLKIFGKPENNSILQAQLFRDLKKFQTKYMNHSGVITYFSSKKIDRCLNLTLEQLCGLDVLSKDSLVNFENIAKVIELLVKIEQGCKEVFGEVLPFSSILYAKKIKDYAKMSGNKIIKVLEDAAFLTTQLINDITAELNRLIWMVTILKKLSLVQKNNHQGIMECFDKIGKILFATKQLQEIDFIHLDFLMDNLALAVDTYFTGLYISCPVLTARSLRSGKWYACVNGHVTCVNTSTNQYYCEECNVVIGPGSFKIEANPVYAEPESCGNMKKNSSKKSDSSAKLSLNYRSSKNSQCDRNEIEPNHDEVMKTQISFQNCTRESSLHDSNLNPTQNEEIKSYEVIDDSNYLSANLSHESLDTNLKQTLDIMKQGTVESHGKGNSTVDPSLQSNLSQSQDRFEHNEDDIVESHYFSSNTTLDSSLPSLKSILSPTHDTIEFQTNKFIDSHNSSINITSDSSLDTHIGQNRDARKLMPSEVIESYIFTNSSHESALDLNISPIHEVVELPSAKDIESPNSSTNSSHELLLYSTLSQTQDTIELEPNENVTDENNSSLPSLNSTFNQTHDTVEFKSEESIESCNSSLNSTCDASLSPNTGQTQETRKLMPSELFESSSHESALDSNVSPTHDAIELPPSKVIENHSSANSSHESASDSTHSLTQNAKTNEFIEKPYLSNVLRNSNVCLNQNSLNVSDLKSKPNHIVAKKNSPDSLLESNLESTKIGTKQDAMNPKTSKDITLENSSTKPPTLLNLMTMPCEDDRFLMKTKSLPNDFNNEVGISKIIKTNKQKVTFNECFPNSKPKCKVITFSNPIPKPKPCIIKGGEQTNTSNRSKHNAKFFNNNEHKNPTNTNFRLKKVTTHDAPKNLTDVKHKRKIVFVNEPTNCTVTKHKRQFIIGDESENRTILKPKRKIITYDIPTIDKNKPKIITYNEPKNHTITMPESMTHGPENYTVTKPRSTTYELENHTISKHKPKIIEPGKSTITKPKTSQPESTKPEIETYNQQELCTTTTHTKPKHKLITYNESDSPTITKPKPKIIEPGKSTITKPKTSQPESTKPKIETYNQQKLCTITKSMPRVITTHTKPKHKLITYNESDSSTTIPKPHITTHNESQNIRIAKPKPKIIFYNDAQNLPTAKITPIITNNELQNLTMAKARTQNPVITKPNPKYKPNPKFISYKELETSSTTEPCTYSSDESVNYTGKANSKFISHDEYNLETLSNSEPYTYAFNESENTFITKPSRKSHFETTSTMEPYTYTSNESGNSSIANHTPKFITLNEFPLQTQLTRERPDPKFISYKAENPQIPPYFHNPIFYSYSQPPNFHYDIFYSYCPPQNLQLPPNFRNPVFFNQIQQNLFHPIYYADTGTKNTQLQSSNYHNNL